MLSSALGLDKASDGTLPNQADGLDPTQAATVQWIQSTGQSPLEFLVETYRSPDPEIRMSDKLSAARALLDYVHRRVPVKQEIDQKVITLGQLHSRKHNPDFFDIIVF